jgi:hypothetical protein
MDWSKTIKQPTIAQVWAQKRNWAKRRLMGVKVCLCDVERDRIVTPWERRVLKDVADALESVMIYWDRNNHTSKENFCGKT